MPKFISIFRGILCLTLLSSPVWGAVPQKVAQNQAPPPTATQTNPQAVNPDGTPASNTGAITPTPNRSRLTQQQMQLQAQARNPQALPNQQLEDLRLNRRIHERLGGLRTYNPADFSVFSQSGFVTIQGRARNSDEAAAVIEAARQVSGVNNVINHIVIDPSM